MPAADGAGRQRLLQRNWRGGRGAAGGRLPGAAAAAHAAAAGRNARGGQGPNHPVVGFVADLSRAFAALVIRAPLVIVKFDIAKENDEGLIACFSGKETLSR